MCAKPCDDRGPAVSSNSPEHKKSTHQDSRSENSVADDLGGAVYPPEHLRWEARIERIHNAIQIGELRMNSELQDYMHTDFRSWNGSHRLRYSFTGTLDGQTIHLWGIRYSEWMEGGAGFMILENTASLSFQSETIATDAMSLADGKLRERLLNLRDEMCETVRVPQTSSRNSETIIDDNMAKLICGVVIKESSGWTKHHVLKTHESPINIEGGRCSKKISEIFEFRGTIGSAGVIASRHHDYEMDHDNRRHSNLPDALRYELSIHSQEDGKMMRAGSGELAQLVFAILSGEGHKLNQHDTPR